MSVLSRICGSLEARINQPRLSILRTIYFNFRTLPFKQAIKLPIFIYGRVRLFGLNGEVIFENTYIKTGMVKIGKNTKISDDSIIGWGSIVTKKFEEPNVVLAGNPAKIVKRGINWNFRDIRNYQIYRESL